MPQKLELRLGEHAFGQVQDQGKIPEPGKQLGQVGPVFVTRPAGHQDVVKVDENEIQVLAHCVH